MKLNKHMSLALEVKDLETGTVLQTIDGIAAAGIVLTRAAKGFEPEASRFLVGGMSKLDLLGARGHLVELTREIDEHIIDRADSAEYLAMLTTIVASFLQAINSALPPSFQKFDPGEFDQMVQVLNFLTGTSDVAELTLMAALR